MTNHPACRCLTLNMIISDLSPPFDTKYSAICKSIHVYIVRMSKGERENYIPTIKYVEKLEKYN